MRWLVPDAVLKGLVTALSTVIVLGLIFLMGKLAGGGATKQEGQIILRQGWLVRGCGLLCMVIAVLSLLGFVADQFTHWMEPPDGRPNPLIFLAGVFVAFGLPAMVEGYRRQLILTEAGLTPRGWFGTGSTIPWTEITNIENNPWAAKFYVRTAAKRIAVSHYLAGLDLFVEECKKRLSPAVYGDAFGKS
jgi:hypothetical protein